VVRRRIFYVTLAILTVLAATAGIMGPTLFLAPPPAPAFSMVELTTLTVLAGQVEVRRSGQTTYQSAPSGIPLAPGDAVRTGPSGRALITYFEGSTTVLEPQSELEIRRLDGEPARAPRLAVHQVAGSTWHKVVRLVAPGPRMEVHTATAVALVRGTEFLVTLIPRSGSLPATLVVVMDGMVDVTAAGVTVTVRAGETTSVEPGQPPSGPQPVAAPRRALVLRVYSPAELLVLEEGTRARLGMRNGIYFSEAIAGQGDRATGAWVYLPAAGDGMYTIVLTATGDGEVTLSAAVVEDGRLAGAAPPDPTGGYGRVIDRRSVTVGVRRGLTYVATLALDREGRIAQLTVPEPPVQALPPFVVARAAVEAARARPATGEPAAQIKKATLDGEVPPFVAAALDLLEPGGASGSVPALAPVGGPAPEPASAPGGAASAGTPARDGAPGPDVALAGLPGGIAAGQESGPQQPDRPQADHVRQVDPIESRPVLAGETGLDGADPGAATGTPAAVDTSERDELLPAVTPTATAQPELPRSDGGSEPRAARDDEAPGMLPTPTPPVPGSGSGLLAGQGGDGSTLPAGSAPVLPAPPAVKQPAPEPTATPRPAPTPLATPEPSRPAPSRTPRGESQRAPGGTNLAASAAGARIHSATFQAPGHPAVQVLDGRDESTWSTRGSPNLTDSVTVELAGDEPVAVSRIVVQPGPPSGMPHAPARIELQVAADSSGAFITVARGVLPGERAQVQEFTFPAAQARYVRLVVSREATDTWCEVGELEVYTAGAAAPAGAPVLSERMPTSARQKDGKG
jgi:hypothetical protein